MRDEGFTLVETLAALAVFSIAAMSILHLSDENTRTARFIEQRALAAIAADNRLTELQISRSPLVIGRTGGETTIAAQELEWVQEVRQTAQVRMLEVVISAGFVSDSNSPFVSLAERHTFVEAP